MMIIGLDIGGANIKAADIGGRTVSRPFAVFRDPRRLPDVLADVLRRFGDSDRIAVTMTAELADCYRTKAEGVDAVLSAVEAAAPRAQLHVWQTGAEFVDPAAAREIPLLVAAANWHALASWAGRIAPQGSALLIDVGSTTTDLTPLRNGAPANEGFTDTERLVSGELVYSGVRRTPLCAIAHSTPFRDGYCPLAAELFATTLDVYLLLGQVPEDADDQQTADSRPATRAAAGARLARMFCADRTEITDDELRMAALFLADVHRQRIAGALDRVLTRQPEECRSVITTGSGAFLAEEITRDQPRLARATHTRLADCMDLAVSNTACAAAVARLAAERLH